MTQTQKCKGVATTVACTNGLLSVIYHSTLVVEANTNTGVIKLDTGGYKTKTTKLRMNQASNEFGLGYQVFQKDYAWYVSYKGQELPFHNDSITLN